MDRESRLLFEAMRGFIQNEKVNFDVQPDWMRLISLANLHAVTGILAYMVLENRSDNTARIEPMMKSQCYAAIETYAKKSEAAKELVSKLNAEGIDTFLFKGSVVRRYYPIPELRSFGDTDILIKSSDREKSHALMLRENYLVKTDWEPVYSYYNDTEVYELHTQLLDGDISDSADCTAYFAEAWQSAVKTGEYCYEPETEFHFVYLVSHIAKHVRSAGAGIRMYMDIALLIKHEGEALDKARLSAALKKLGLKKFSDVVFTVCERYFGVKAPFDIEPIPDNILEDFMEYTINGGVFGHSAAEGSVNTMRKANESSRAAAVLHRLFPAASTIESRYTYLQGRHWLLPAAWLHRIFITREKWGEHTAEAKALLEADREKLNEVNSLYENIGLKNN